MTDDERRMEDMMLGKHLGKDKGTIKFMQKYYHKGAFYMVSRRYLTSEVATGVDVPQAMSKCYICKIQVSGEGLLSGALLHVAALIISTDQQQFFRV